MHRRAIVHIAGPLLVGGCLLMGCNESATAEERERLVVENARLTTELERTREALRGLELQIQRLKAGQAEAEAAPTGAEATAELLRTLAERDRELEQLRLDLDEARALALRFRQAGERAVEELNRERPTTPRP